MNKTDRLLAIVLELQGRKLCRAEELAEQFEVSIRTIYRDMQSLQEAGVPILSTPNRGYELVDGYFLPPVAFNGDEATMLLMGASFMAENFDTKYRQAAIQAGKKIEAILHPKLSEEVDYLRENIRFITHSTHPENQVYEYLLLLRRAIVEQKSVAMTYYKPSSKGLEREVDPHCLYYSRGIWMLSAYCHLREGIRIFRLDRMEELEVLNQQFFRRADHLIREAEMGEQGRHLQVRLQLNNQYLSQLYAQLSLFIEVVQKGTFSSIITLRVRDYHDLLSPLLLWGKEVKILYPSELQTLILEKINKLKLHFSKFLT